LVNNNFLTSPIDAVVFDCDCTLTHLEGVNYLAKLNNIEDEIVALTEDAMEKGHLSQSLYAKRLSLINPTKNQLETLGQAYFDHKVSDILSVITALKKLNKAIFIVSAGILYPVRAFAKKLGIPSDNVFAVDLYFENSQYHDFDRKSVLIENTGKQSIIKKIKEIYPRLAYVGDGANDLCCISEVERFIGFGGIIYRELIESQSDFYLKSPEMLPLLSLVFTKDEFKQIQEIS
jgi:phosphoserine phosphatase